MDRIAEAYVKLVLEITKKLEERSLNQTPPPGLSRKDHIVKIHEEVTNKFTIKQIASLLTDDRIVDPLDLYEIIKINSIILPVLRTTWIEAAGIKHELRKKIKHFGLIDAILVAKQKELKCKVISGDPHFKSLSNVLYIGS